jgi:hypothetical protein
VANVAGQLAASGPDANAAGRLLDSHLDALEEAMDATFVPEVGEVRAEGPEPLGREGEVERLRQRDRGRRR